jgi:hypothetical protein
MTMSDPSLDRPGGDPKDELEDEQLVEGAPAFAVDGSRPLTAEEKEAAGHDTGVAERVYAPASERVPKEPVPGHRDFVQHTDVATPERQAAATTDTPTAPTPRPSPSPGPGPGSGPTGSAYASGDPFAPRGTTQTQTWTTSPVSTPYTFSEPPSTNLGLPIGIGSAVAAGAAAVGIWLFVRWQRERNKPMNRLRRQARHAAAELRERVPDSDDLVRPAMGLAAAVASALLVLLKNVQSQHPERAIERISDADFQKRLFALKQHWDPRRLELEKVSISRR